MTAQCVLACAAAEAQQVARIAQCNRHAPQERVLEACVWFEGGMRRRRRAEHRRQGPPQRRLLSHC